MGARCRNDDQHGAEIGGEDVIEGPCEQGAAIEIGVELVVGAGEASAGAGRQHHRHDTGTLGHRLSVVARPGDACPSNEVTE